jgi:hypothetical protein
MLGNALDLLAARLDSAEIPRVWRLGDFTPWNAGIEKEGRRVACVDVEYAEAEGIPGWDIFHFMTSAAGRSIRGLDIASIVMRECPGYFDALAIERTQIPSLYAAYLADQYTLWARMWARHDGPLTAPASETLAMLMRLLDESMRTHHAERS